MKRSYRHIALWLFLPSLLVSTGGISLHTLYCLCKGETRVSLFLLPDQCAEKKEKAPVACCAKHKACPKPATEASPDKQDHDCTKRGVWFAKLNTPFLSVTDDHQFHPVFPEVVLPSFFFIQGNAALGKRQDYLSPEEHGPPLPSGMALRRFLKSYRC